MDRMLLLQEIGLADSQVDYDVIEDNSDDCNMKFRECLMCITCTHYDECLNKKARENINRFLIGLEV